MPKKIDIAELRSRLCIFKTQQIPDPSSSGMITERRILGEVSAKIEPISPLKLIGDTQLDQDIGVATHTAIVRWIEWPDINCYAVRDLLLPDQSERKEYFRIVDVADYDSARWCTTLHLKLLDECP